MSKTTKVLLALALSCLTAGLGFVTGIVNVGEAVSLYVTLPAGAILFGLFLISLSLQAQSALFDEGQRMASAALAKTHPTAAPKSCCVRGEPGEKEAYSFVH